MADSLTIAPIGRVDGTVRLPGSKSISNRVLLLAALAEGKTEIDGLLQSDDVAHLLRVLPLLGVEYHLSGYGQRCELQGNAGPLRSSSTPLLFLGNAGTVMRPLTALLSIGETGGVVLDGDRHMRLRPIAPLVEALRQGGAKVEYLGSQGYPPLRLLGGFQGGTITVDSQLSSQFLTALLMAAPLAPCNSEIIVPGDLASQPYVDLTVASMRRFGVVVQSGGCRHFTIQGGQHYRSPGHFQVEGDASSASYFLAAGAIKGGKVRVVGVGRESLQGEVRFAELLAEIGAEVYWGEDYIEVGPPCSTSLGPIDRNLNSMPDTALTAAIVALFATGKSTISGIHHWRIKECDRLQVMAELLSSVGAEVVTGGDFIRITPPVKFRAATIDPHGDHRIAMCFSLLALSGVPVTLLQPRCVSKSFPDYFSQFASLVTT